MNAVEDYSRRWAKLQNKYVVVPAEKASNNVVFVYKVYYYQCLLIKLVFSNIYTHNMEVRNLGQP